MAAITYQPTVGNKKARHSEVSHRKLKLIMLLCWKISGGPHKHNLEAARIWLRQGENVLWWWCWWGQRASSNNPPTRDTKWTSTAKQVLGNCDCTRPGADWRWTGYGEVWEGGQMEWRGDAPTWGELGLCWGMHRVGVTWVLHRHSMTEGAHRLHPEDSLRCKWRASWRAWWRCWWGQRAWTSWRTRSRQSRRILTKTLLLTKACVAFKNKVWCGEAILNLRWGQGSLYSVCSAIITTCGQRLYFIFPPSLRGRPEHSEYSGIAFCW